MLETRSYLAYHLLAAILVIMDALCSQVQAAACTQGETMTCISQSGLDITKLFCMTTDPSTCNPDDLCHLSKWKNVAECTDKAGCTLAMTGDQCTTRFGVCDTAFVSGLCGGEKPHPTSPTAVPSTPVPPSPTLPPSRTGVDLTNMVFSRPNTLKFGMVGDTTKLLTGCIDISGVEMGFQQVNAKGGAHGTKLEIELDHVDFTDGAAAATASYNQLLHKGTFAFIQTSNDVSAAVYNQVANPLGIPMINPVSPLPPMYRDRNVLMVRSIATQALFNVVNVAMHGPAKCSRIGIFGLDVPALRDIGDMFSDIAVKMGLSRPASVYTNFVPPTTPEEINQRIEPIFSDDENLPHCVLLLMTRTENFYMSYIRRHPKAFKDISFLLLPIASPTEQLRDAIDNSTSWFKNRVFVIQTFPDPNHPTSTLAADYRAALANYAFRDNMTHCPRVPTPLQFEVYTAARFVAEVVSRMTTFSREEFVNTVFRTKMFPIEDALLGPFNDACSGLSTAEAITCFCTNGGHGIYSSEIDEHGMMIGGYDNQEQGEFGTRDFYIPLQTCAVENPRQSIAFATRFSTIVSTSGPPNPVVTKLINNLHRFMVGTNRLNQQTQRLYRSYPVPGSYDPSSIGATALTTAEHIGDRYDVVAFVGGSSDVPEGSLYLNATTETIDGQLPTEPVRYNPQHINFVPRLQDYIHTLAAFASVSLHRGDEVEIVAESSDLENYARQSVETFGFAPTSSTTPNNISDGIALTKATGVVLVVASTVEGVTSALTAASRHAAKVVLVAASEDHLLASSPAVNDRVPTNVHFASMFPAFWRADASAFANAVFAAADSSAPYLGLTNNTSAALSQSATPAELRAALQIFLMDAAAADQEGLTPATFEEWLYQPSTRDAKGVTMRPMSKLRCDEQAAGVLCECNNAIRQFYVHNLTLWFTLGAGGQEEFVYANPNCHVEYTSLPIESNRIDSLSTAMIGVIAAACAVLVLAGGLVVIVVLTSGRNTAAAPKNPEEPFAMVFTDIQSSTTLWAEVPESMSEGVETHHIELRKLVSKHRGYEVKTIGDSFMVAFKSAGDAARFALGVQSSLLAVDWGTEDFDSVYDEQMKIAMEARGKVDKAQFMGQTDRAVWRGIRVRVGVHFGYGTIQKDEVTGGYDYYGTVVNTAARVESVGNGGQVLLTEAAFSAIPEGEAIGDVEVVDMGAQQLRGLPEPVRLMQCTPKSLSSRKYPPLRTEENGADENDDDQTSEFLDEFLTTPSDEEKASVTSGGDADSENSGKEAMTSKVVRRGWRDAHAQEVATMRLNDGFSFIVGILATSNKTYRSNFIAHVANKWRVNFKKKKNSKHHNSTSSSQEEEAALVMVLAKVLKSIETRERRRTSSIVVGEALTVDSLGNNPLSIVPSTL